MPKAYKKHKKPSTDYTRVTDLTVIISLCKLSSYGTYRETAVVGAFLEVLQNDLEDLYEEANVMVLAGIDLPDNYIDIVVQGSKSKTYIKEVHRGVQDTITQLHNINKKLQDNGILEDLQSDGHNTTLNDQEREYPPLRY